MAQDAVKTTTLAPSSGQNLDNNHGDRRIPITTPKTRPQSPDLQQRGDSSLDENKSNSQRESVTGTATIRVEKNPNFTPTSVVPPNEYTTISAAGRHKDFSYKALVRGLGKENYQKACGPIRFLVHSSIAA